MKKIDYAKILIDDNINLFSCPICKSKFHIDGNQIKCDKNHSFDLSKNGYLNLLLNSKIKSRYEKELFEARNKIFKYGLFNKATKFIENIILDHAKTSNSKRFSILDAGCGEGSHLAHIIDNLDKNRFKAMGIDIFKEAISIAAREYQNIIWAVAHISKAPFHQDTFNVILNILSPSNYEEFNRLLINDGILIKVVPGKFHLYELRKILYDKTDKEIYSNKQVIEHFQNNFKIYDIQNLQYRFPLSKDMLPFIIKMTPLSWGADIKKIKEISELNICKITVDLSIIVGKTKG